MGMINIQTMGSFKPQRAVQFKAESGGHADAVARAIEWLAGTMLPDAIRQDHALHKAGVNPRIGFGEREREINLR